LREERNMIKPTVGRVVWYREPNGTEDLAAFIAGVVDDHHVHLTIFPPLFPPYTRSEVYLLQDNETLGDAGAEFCQWMPYQLGQAAKTEHLEESLRRATGDAMESDVARATLLHIPKSTSEIEKKLSFYRDPIHDFGWALKQLRNGSRVQRAGWNGKGMFLFIVAQWFWNATFEVNAGEQGMDKLPFIAMKTADDKIVPWLASQTDILAVDWGVVEINKIYPTNEK
jgi:hypothetical protein